MKGEVSHELEVNVPATKAWELYSTLKIANLVVTKLPNIIDKIVVLHGDGGAGTVLQLFFPSGTPGLTSMKEKFIAIDAEKMTKISDVVEGGFLDMGFTLYKVIFQIVEKGSDSCIIRSIIQYEVGEELAATAAGLVTTDALEAFALAAAAELTKTPEPVFTVENLVFIE